MLMEVAPEEAARMSGSSNALDVGKAKVTLLSARAEVVGTEVESKERVVFLIKVQVKGESHDSYTIKRRYKEFDTLQSSLKVVLE